jgi:DNA-directed RNA polymerase subunit RPC12/RpoP
MANYYCEYCGTKRASVTSILTESCLRHPLGAGKGKHKLYEGSEKAKYSCKYCGKDSSSISSLTSSSCRRHPDGSGKGQHSPE